MFYSVHFIDAKDGLQNHKLFESLSENAIRKYMEFFGHTLIRIDTRDFVLEDPFIDKYASPIYNGATLYYEGEFPKSTLPERQIRYGVAVIQDGFLHFAINDNGILRETGLYWEFDGKPCYDLMIIERR